MSGAPPAAMLLANEQNSNEQEGVKATDTGPNIPQEPGFKVYKPSTLQAAAGSSSLPDSYFIPTAADLKAAQATLSARTQGLVNAPLQLKVTREANERAKKERWPNTTIRIKFTDRTQLEKVFSSTDKIRSVYAFVRSSLREDVKPVKFILYQSPPKRDLKVSDPTVRDLTLAELQLAPSSILLLRFEDESLNASDFPAPLASSIIDQAIDLPAPPDYDVGPAINQPASPYPLASGSDSRSAEKKVPKWLKMGLKK